MTRPTLDAIDAWIGEHHEPRPNRPEGYPSDNRGSWRSGRGQIASWRFAPSVAPAFGGVATSSGARQGAQGSRRAGGAAEEG